jgi:adenine-specific DNA-methyltransferase
MNMKLSKYEIQDLIERLQKSENIPNDYKYKLFPAEQKEYELVYGGKMRKEDVLANEDGVFPVPLQIEKIFNGKRKAWKDGWRNIIAFGDNLQFLKTIYDNKDPLIKDKVKGKVKLIYIDPPFATASDFKSINGQKAYADKQAGSDFIEFIRRRLVVAKEILSDDGSIYIHLDHRKSHHIKIVADEIFGESSFRNNIVWCYSGGGIPKKELPKKYDDILWYTKSSNNWIFNPIFRPYSEGTVERGRTAVKGENAELNVDGTIINNWWTDVKKITSPTDYEKLNYPTQKSEELLSRIIQLSSNEGDIILDFFAGSGTTASVAEKLNRKWISCDIGKLSFYTIQKRMLNIEQSKLLTNSTEKYGKPAKSFITLNAGQYDLEKVFNLKSAEYSNFVLNLFEIEPIKKTISGIKINGERKDGYHALIWPYWEFKDASVDEEYLHNLHSNIGKKIGDRIYIVAPASYVDFISDYYEIGNVRYYFLKVPYHIIKELHKVQFKKFRQPQSKKNVNDLEDAIGFHFMKQPEVETKVTTSTKDVKICIKKFNSDFSEDGKGKELGNLESLAMVLIDKSFDGQAFDMDEYYFAEDLLPKKKGKKDDGNVGEELKKTKEINLPSIPKKDCGKNLMIIYVDIFGNEFKEKFEIE